MKQLKIIVAFVLALAMQEYAVAQKGAYSIVYLPNHVISGETSFSFSDSTVALFNRLKAGYRKQYLRASTLDTRPISYFDMDLSSDPSYSEIDTLVKFYPDLEGIIVVCTNAKNKEQQFHTEICHHCLDEICKLPNLKFIQTFVYSRDKSIPQNLIRLPPCLKDAPELVALMFDHLDPNDYPILENVFQQRQLILFRAFGKIIPFDSSFLDTIVQHQRRLEYLQLPILINRIPDDIYKLDSLRVLDLVPTWLYIEQPPIYDTASIQLSWGLTKLKNLKFLHLGFLDLSKRENIDILTAIPNLEAFEINISVDNYKNIDWAYFETKLVSSKINDVRFQLYSRKKIKSSKRALLQKPANDIMAKFPKIEIAFLKTNMQKFEAIKIPKNFSKYDKRMKKWYKSGGLENMY